MTHKNIAITLCIVVFLYFSGYFVAYAVDKYQEHEIADGYIDKPKDCYNYLKGYSDNFCEFMNEKGDRCTYSIEISWVMNCHKAPQGSRWVKGRDGNVSLAWDHDEEQEESGYERAPTGFAGYGLTREL